VGGYSDITTEIRVGCPFYYADLHHQQYLAKPRSRQYCSAEPTGLALPAWTEWPWPPHDTAEDPSCAVVAQAKQMFAPLLPEEFWGVYDFSINAPDEPAGVSVEELSTAERHLSARRACWEASVAKAEKDDSVLVQHCASCGYSRRAVELAAFLKTACGMHARVGVIADAMAGTGRFEIKVKNAGDEGLQLVHSKKAGHGFVDSAEKLARILDVIAQANPSCSLPRQLDALTTMARNFSGLRDKAAIARRKLGPHCGGPLLDGETEESPPMIPPKPSAPILLMSKTRRKSKRG